MDESTLTREERNDLVARIQEIDRLMNPPPDQPQPTTKRRLQLKEALFQALGEYSDRLPRVIMSACPFTGRHLKRAFDPYGLDGPWWHKDRFVSIEEPSAPTSFKVLLGALSLQGRIPEEVTENVIPGPEIPYVVPRLLDLPGMTVVISQLELDTGDVAYPIAYFSEESIPAGSLHQPWLRQEHWFKNDKGHAVWSIHNDVWDFDLEPYIAAGKLKWIQPGDPSYSLHDNDSDFSCPYSDLPGNRLPQSLEDGEQDFMDLPTGELLNPFED
jgi:hypothetical protein